MKSKNMFKMLSYEDVKDIKIKEYGVDTKEDGLYYGLFKEDKLASIINVIRFSSYVKFRVNYTFPEYRGKGLFTELLQNMLDLYKGHNIKADCLDSSCGIYLKNGFTKVKEKQFKYYKVHYVERSN